MQKPLLQSLCDHQQQESQDCAKLKYRYKVNCLDKLTYGWISPLLQHGVKQVIKQEVLEDLSVEEQSQSIYYRWNDYWNEQKKNNSKDPLFSSIRHSFKKNYIIGTIFDFFAYQFTIMTPVFIYFSIKYLGQDRQLGWTLFYLVMILLIRFGRSFCQSHAIFYLSLVGTEISNSVSIGMVGKAMKYSVLCNKQFKMGEITNLMQVDCFRLSLLPRNFNAVVFISYCLLFSVIFMAMIVGYAFLAGFIVLFLISIINMVIAKFTTRYQKQFAIAADNRMKITSEVFNNIKFIKVNAWEECFYDKLMSKRSTELGWLRKKLLSESFSAFSMWLAPKLILAATYGLYVATEGHLSPQKTFSIMCLFGYIQFYLQYLTNSLGITFESFKALKRIQKFLLAEQIDLSCINYDRFDLPSRDYKSNSIQMEHGNFYWDKDFQEQQSLQSQKELFRKGSVLSNEGSKKEADLHLQDINFTVKKGEMVAIIGGIGSGKSSLLYSLLGEMKIKDTMIKPRVVVNGTMSLVTQKPWITNDTVRNNILFGQRYDPVRYKQAIKYSCLDRDIELFSFGDQTMIGQKGATLSGGQKARICFARSLYSNSDILLLDDLLSAVDIHVGKFLMIRTLLGYAKDKTRVIVTHALYYLQYVDKILIMQDGKIVEQGNYEAIKSGNRFKQIQNSMMKEEKTKRRSSSTNILHQKLLQEIVSIDSEKEEELIEDEIILDASVLSKKSQTYSAVDRTRLEVLQKKKSSLKMLSCQQQLLKVHKFEMFSHPDKEVDIELMTAEDMSQISVFKLYGSFARYNFGFRFLALVIFVQILWMLCNSLSNIWLVKWTDYSDGASTSYSTEFYLIGYIIIGILYAAFSFIRALMTSCSSVKMSDTIHESMVSNLLFASLTQFFDRVPLGRIFNRLSNDLNSVDMNLIVNYNNILVFVFFLGSNIVVISFLAPIYIFWPIIIIYLIICHFLRMYYSKPAKELTKIKEITKSPIISCFSEILQGVSTIRCCRKENMFIQNNCLKIDENKKPIIARKAVQVWFTFRLMLCSLIINFSSLVYVLFFMEANQQNASMGALIIVVTLGFDEIMYFLASNLGAFEAELISIERCEAFMNIQPENGYTQYMHNRQLLKEKSRERRILKAGGWPDKGRIDFIDFQCRYRKNLDLAIKGLNVTISGGQKIGVVGRTGSGKSMIIMCLLRVLEAAEGRIMIDGRDISQLSLDDLRSKITIILQDPCLFAGTIKENLDPLGEYSEEELNKALDLCALRKIMDERQGLQTEITENGENLSIGQRQLVSIARSILKPSKIVLIDEATANIDVLTESIIYRAMNESFKHSTVITVAHRLNTVINSDRILVMQGGQLKQFDNPQQLLKNPNSFFTQLYNQSQKQNKM